MEQVLPPSSTVREGHSRTSKSWPEYGGVAGPVNSGSWKDGHRRKLNLVAICENVFLPWLLFCVLCAVWSFSMHYQNPPCCYLATAIGIVIVGAMGWMALQAVRKKRTAREREPSWFIFLFFASAIAWVAAVVFGDLIYIRYIRPYYDLHNLNTYSEVDPSQKHGLQLMDAGRVGFANTSALDVSRSMGFREEDIYCVAPIVLGTETLMSYDFWAVGINCCSGNLPDFHCPEFSNQHAHSGLRVMQDDQRAFYRLAVQQAEATFNIKATHPLFFEWMQDPDEQLSSYYSEGVRLYLQAVATHFAFSLICVTAATVGFSKLGYY